MDGVEEIGKDEFLESFELVCLGWWFARIKRDVKSRYVHQHDEKLTICRQGAICMVCDVRELPECT